MSSAVPRRIEVVISVAAALLVVGLAGTPRARADVEITACGQVFSGKAFLGDSLNCAGVTGPAIQIDGRGVLDLRGFTVVGGEQGILCQRSCEIVGGTVTQALEDGVSAASRVRAVNLTATGNGRAGVRAGMHIAILNSTLSDNAEAGFTSLNGRVRLVDSSVTNNLIGGSAATGMRLIRSTIQANDLFGAFSTRIALVDSVIKGNSLGASCGVTEICADIRSFKKPRLNRSACDTSHIEGLGTVGGSWGVCTQD